MEVTHLKPDRTNSPSPSYDSLMSSPSLPIPSESEDTNSKKNTQSTHNESKGTAPPVNTQTVIVSLQLLVNNPPTSKVIFTNKRMLTTMAYEVMKAEAIKE